MKYESISNELQYLHRLAWQPGGLMHSDWWFHFDLAQWRESYERYPACRLSIDRLINRRRGFPVAPLPARVDRQQAALLALGARFCQLIRALGLIVLDCQDYLLMKPYRTVLARQFGANGCDQLYGLKPVWQGTERLLPAEQLPDAAFSAGARWFQRDAQGCIVLTLLATQLPPAVKDVNESDTQQTVAAVSNANAPTAASWLLKIGRFLL